MFISAISVQRMLRIYFDRHRQEILKKLQVRNSIEACRVAGELGILR